MKAGRLKVLLSLYSGASGLGSETWIKVLHVDMQLHNHSTREAESFSIPSMMFCYTVESPRSFLTSFSIRLVSSWLFKNTKVPQSIKIKVFPELCIRRTNRNSSAHLTNGPHQLLPPTLFQLNNALSPSPQGE